MRLLRGDVWVAYDAAAFPPADATLRRSFKIYGACREQLSYVFKYTDDDDDNVEKKTYTL